MTKEEERLNKAQQIANIGNWDQDVQTGELWWSDQTYRIFGLEPQSVPMSFLRFLSMVVPEDRAAVTEATKAATGDLDAAYCVRYHIHRPDGSQRHLYEEAVVDRDRDGNAVRMVGVVHDITERTAAERIEARYREQLRHLEKMEAVKTLAGGVAHEINNLLGIIIGYTECVQDRIDANSENEQDLRQIVDAAMRAKRLILQVLVFSAHKMGTHAPLDLSGLVRDSLELARDALPDEVRLFIDVEQGIDNVVGASSQITQVLTNLLNNAAEAAQATGGLVHAGLKRIPADRVPISSVPGLARMDYARLRVRDTGSGISRKHLPRIFDPFFTTKPFGHGQGMGLAVVHGIVEAHGGAKHVQSEPGVGTTVDVYLPIHRDTAQASAGQERNPAEPARILLVDDHEALRHLTAKNLETIGCLVDQAANGFEALDRFLGAPNGYDLVFTDQSMEGMTGLALSRKIKTLRPDLPVIVCTGHSDLLEEEDAKRHGASQVIYKPLRREELQESVLTALA